MLRTIIPAIYVRMAAAARRNRGSASVANLKDLRGTVETEIPATHALDDGSGELVTAIQ
jgi:hypothetical protein